MKTDKKFLHKGKVRTEVLFLHSMHYHSGFHLLKSARFEHINLLKVNVSATPESLNEEHLA